MFLNCVSIFYFVSIKLQEVFIDLDSMIYIQRDLSNQTLILYNIFPVTALLLGCYLPSVSFYCSKHLIDLRIH